MIEPAVTVLIMSGGEDLQVDLSPEAASSLDSELATVDFEEGRSDEAPANLGFRGFEVSTKGDAYYIVLPTSVLFFDDRDTVSPSAVADTTSAYETIWAYVIPRLDDEIASAILKP